MLELKEVKRKNKNKPATKKKEERKRNRPTRKEQKKKKRGRYCNVLEEKKKKQKKNQRQTSNKKSKEKKKNKKTVSELLHSYKLIWVREKKRVDYNCESISFNDKGLSRKIKLEIIFFSKKKCVIPR